MCCGGAAGIGRGARRPAIVTRTADTARPGLIDPTDETTRRLLLAGETPARRAGEMMDAARLVGKGWPIAELTEEGRLMNTRTIAIAALVVAIILLLIFLL